MSSRIELTWQKGRGQFKKCIGKRLDVGGQQKWAV